MTTDNAVKRLTEEELFFYEDQVCGEAELVYRFCIGMSLDQDTGFKLLKQTYRKAAAQLSSMRESSGSDLRAHLIKIAFGLADSATKPARNGDSPVLNFLSQLEKQDRAIVLARDLVGLNLEQIGKSLDLKQSIIVSKLGTVRKSLKSSLG